MIIGFATLDAELGFFKIQGEGVGHQKFHELSFAGDGRDSGIFYRFFRVDSQADLCKAETHAKYFNMLSTSYFNHVVRQRRQGILAKNPGEIQVPAQLVVFIFQTELDYLEVGITRFFELVPVKPTRRSANQQCLPQEISGGLVNFHQTKLDALPIHIAWFNLQSKCAPMAGEPTSHQHYPFFAIPPQ